MGRPTKDYNDKKISISICLEKGVYYRMKNDGEKPSRIIEKLLKEYYGNKDLQ
jgi:hypothetical protein